jgi:Protein of unknown function (DUF3592)
MNSAYVAVGLFGMILVSCMVFADLRYTLRRLRSKKWPTTVGRIDEAMVGFRGPFSRLPRILYRLHFTYSYRVDGLQPTGRFFLLSRGKHSGQELRRALVGQSVLVKYDHRKPGTALLVDNEMAGKRVIQGPGFTYH